MYGESEPPPCFTAPEEEAEEAEEEGRLFPYTRDALANQEERRRRRRSKSSSIITRERFVMAFQRKGQMAHRS